MKEEPTTPLSGTVEVDEVYLGGKPRNGGKKNERGVRNKYPVLAMLERGGRVRTQPMTTVTGDTLRAVMKAHIDFTNSTLMTDEHRAYTMVGKEFKRGHHKVSHGRGEYVRGDATTNNVEGFFSLLRRSLHGIYHSVSPEHLPKYLAEAEFRYTHRTMTDGQRTVHAIKSGVGKHITYEQSKA